MAPELHGSLATWPSEYAPKLHGSLKLSYKVPELQDSLETKLQGS